MRSTTLKLCLATSLTAVLVACGGSRDAGSGNASNDPVEDATEPTNEPSVRTASVPADPCDWIPVSEVEAVVGKLAEPPKREDGCRYTMVMPESVSARRQEAVAQRERLNAQLKAAFKDYQPLEVNGSMAEYEHDPRTYAVTLNVDVSGNTAGELGAAAAGKVLASWLPPQAGDGQDTTEEPAKSDGWDVLLPMPYGFAARSGHVQISVLGQAPDVPPELSQALATHVRDRIPDLPFPATNRYQVVALAKEGKHPCSLLTRAEAEAVLGPLAVDPYRASSYYPPLAHGTGHGCAYYTAGHNVFSIIPVWTGGEESFKLEKGIGGLIGIVAPQENVMFKGPWDAAQASGATGALLFLKGDRLLEVHYLTSSTDRGGAVRLAAQAIQRM